MFGIVVMGHGNFAQGLGASLRMVAGNPAHYKEIAFLEDEPIDALPKKLDQAVTELLKETEGVLIFTDLVGGTPFKVAFTYAHDKENVAVLCGTNLGMIIEANFMRSVVDDLYDLAIQLVEIGKEQVSFVDKLDTDIQDDQDFDDDI